MVAQRTDHVLIFIRPRRRVRDRAAVRLPDDAARQVDDLSQAPPVDQAGHVPRSRPCDVVAR
jgi:hypothetical protein